MDLSLDWIFNFEAIFRELAARVVSGPMQFRLIGQPCTAILLGIRDGRADARARLPPFIVGVLLEPGARKSHLKSALWRLRGPIFFATLADATVQFLMFQHVRPLMALLVGSLLMGLPYSAARGLSNRVHARTRKPDS